MENQGGKSPALWKYSVVREGCTHLRFESTIDPPDRNALKSIVIRLRHPDGRKMKSAAMNGMPHADFDPKAEFVRLRPTPGRIVVRAEY